MHSYHSSTAIQCDQTYTQHTLMHVYVCVCMKMCLRPPRSLELNFTLPSTLRNKSVRLENDFELKSSSKFSLSLSLSFFFSLSLSRVENKNRKFCSKADVRPCFLWLRMCVMCSKKNKMGPVVLFVVIEEGIFNRTRRGCGQDGKKNEEWILLSVQRTSSI